MLVPALVGVVLLLFLLVGNVLYSLIKMMVQGSPVHDVLLVLAYRTPSVLMLAVPGALLLGTALALNRLERDRELLALRMAGVRLTRLVVPYIVLAALVVVSMFFLQERVIPRCTHLAERLTAKLIWGTPSAVVRQDEMFKADANNYIYVHTVDQQTNTLHGVKIFNMERGYLSSMMLIPIAVNHNGVWKVSSDPVTGVKPRVYEFNEKGETTKLIEGDEGILNLKQDMLNYLSDQPSTSDELTLSELQQLEHGVRGTGVGLSNGMSLNPDLLTFYVQRRFAAPLSALVAVLIAIPLSVHFGRNGGYVGLLLSVVVAFCFLVSQQWAQALAETNNLQPILAAWSPDAAFGLLGVFLLLREE